MPINKTLIACFLFISTFLSSVLCSAQKSAKARMRPRAPHAVIPYKHTTLNAPPGMVYIKGGSTTIRYNQSTTDTNSNKKASLTSFFIDKTEVTNDQYRQFTNWVIDSIAVVKYLKDDKYFLEQKKGKKGDKAKTESAVAVVDTTKRLGDTTAKTAVVTTPGDTSTKLALSVPDTAITNKRINWAKVDHKKIFNSKDEEIKNKIAPMLDENGNIRKEFYVFSYTYIKPVVNKDGVTKAEYKTVPVNIYPNEAVWAQDMVNSQTDMYVENYFKIEPFNDYPVVGVNWLQANAYAYWRGKGAGAYYKMPHFMKYYHLTYTLPSEAQWVYAAQGYLDMISTPDSLSDSLSKMAGASVPSDSLATPHDSTQMVAILAKAGADSAANASKEQRAELLHKMKKKKHGDYYIADYFRGHDKYKGKYSDEMGTKDFGGPYVDSTPIHRDINGMLENFKQEEGDYWEDGSALTTPVLSFAPNEFGLYNMEGNVAEWCQDAYSPSAYAFVSDLNPVLNYDADSSDVDAMKRKVVRGGSFMSNAGSLTPYYRDLELQNMSHCFIGFRCVMQAPDILYKNVSTRRKTFKGKEANGKPAGTKASSYGL